MLDCLLLRTADEMDQEDEKKKRKREQEEQEEVEEEKAYLSVFIVKCFEQTMKARPITDGAGIVPSTVPLENDKVEVRPKDGHQEFWAIVVRSLDWNVRSLDWSEGSEIGFHVDYLGSRGAC